MGVAEERPATRHLVDLVDVLSGQPFVDARGQLQNVLRPSLLHTLNRNADTLSFGEMRAPVGLEHSVLEDRVDGGLQRPRLAHQPILQV